MKLYFLRHGVTDFNQRYLFQGQIDTPLNDEGRRQAMAEGARLHKSVLTFDRIYSSPLSRALDTCHLVTGAPQEAILRDARLLEIGYGPYEGKPIMDSDPAMWAFLKTPYAAPPPEGVESLERVQARMENALRDILAACAPGQSALICSHGIALAALFRAISAEHGDWLKEKFMAKHARLYVSDVEGGHVGMPRPALPSGEAEQA